MRFPFRRKPAVAGVPTGTEALYQGVVPYQASLARAHQRSNRVLKRTTTVSLGANLALGAALVAMLPLKSVVPVFVYLNEAGLLDTTTAISSLPPDTHTAAIEALLWQYVAHREHYSAPEADTDYTIVSAMSAPDVRQQYQNWANAKLNQDAPANKLGPNGFIRINQAPNGAEFLSHAADYSSGVYHVRFCRTVVREGQPKVSQRMQVSFSYATVENVPVWERRTFNSAGVVITEYPGPTAEGANNGVVASCG